MEIISIERNTYEEMINCFSQFSRKVVMLCDENKEKGLSEWLDSQEVCMILDIGKRKLQYLRNSRKLNYSVIGGKNYYKPEDVQKVLKQNKDGKGESDG